MEHVAILRKAKVSKTDDLLEEIIAGRKTIESRWYVNKISPWNRVKINEVVYFKESGGPVRARASVAKVMQFENLDKKLVQEILDRYGQKIAPGASESDLTKWQEKLVEKRYCILIFLKKVEKVKPFFVDKTGFGYSCAWMVVEKIDLVK